MSRKTQPIRRPLSLCSSVAALRPDMLTCDNMFISLKDSEELPLSLLRGLWWLALERSAAVTTEQHGLGREDEVNKPPICWWVWKMKHKSISHLSKQDIFNVTSRFCFVKCLWHFLFDEFEKSTSRSIQKKLLRYPNFYFWDIFCQISYKLCDNF